MQKFLLFAFILVQSITLRTFSQELEFDDGLYCEKPIYNDTSRCRYSKDNLTYLTNMVFIFDYYYVDNSAIKKKFLDNIVNVNPDNPLGLVDYNDTARNVIRSVKIIVCDWLNEFLKFDSSYSQTIIFYDHVNIKDSMVGKEITGLIDNKKNLWFHPPLSSTFRMLKINPFPFYYLDESIKKWTWKLVVGGGWSDYRWLGWQGEVSLDYTYTRQNDEDLNCRFGVIKCKVVNGVMTSEINNMLVKTYLKSYYNKQYGFLKLEYINVNGSRIVLDLIDIKKNNKL